MSTKRKREEQCTEIGLTDSEILQFQEQGFVLLRNAFPSIVAKECREILWERLRTTKQIDRTDPTTWVTRIGLTDIFYENDGEPWKHVFTQRLKRAIDQLCGENQWKEFGCGWWVITFPQKEEPPWTNSGSWHIDGAHYHHHINSKESGLLPIFLFSSIQPTEGGTALCVGSHRIAAQLLSLYEPKGLKGKKMSQLVHQYIIENDLLEIVEVNGTAGDVMLTHPFLLHARSKNLGEKGIDSVRFMCNPNVEFINAMRFPRQIDTRRRNEICKTLSPVERVIVESVMDTAI